MLKCLVCSSSGGVPNWLTTKGTKGHEGKLLGSNEGQNLNFHTMLPDGIATVGQSPGRGFERHRL
jgi:hypothetical protein